MSGEIGAFLDHLENEQGSVEFFGDRPLPVATDAGWVHIESDPDAVVAWSLNQVEKLD